MSNLRADERASIQLRGMYQQYGYLPYKVSRFEEYDLYMQNKRFLTSEHVLAFSDLDGKLMALKPDVTLSVIKNTKDGDTLKLSYAERVYRVPRGGQCFKEIMQTGLEVIGRVDAYAMGEVLMLAARSLQTISGAYVLDVADLGIVSGVFEAAGLSDAQRTQALACISEKNLHALTQLCGAWGVIRRATEQLCALVTVYGPLETTLERFEAMGLPEGCRPALGDLRAVRDMMRLYGVGGVNLDFSVVNDMNYYNGLIFAGFIDGVPASVLSGGRYDNLMRKMGRSSQAIGFAVYLDQLERLMDVRPAYDVDVLIAYDDAAEPAQFIDAARTVTAQGESVRVQREGATAVRFRRKISLCGGEAKR